jgi:hypothetical protein
MCCASFPKVPFDDAQARHCELATEQSFSRGPLDIPIKSPKDFPDLFT